MSDLNSILVVEDDVSVAETLADQIMAHTECSITIAYSAQEAEQFVNAKETNFDAIILDVGLPDEDGRSLCSRLRGYGINTPIIMLTGSADESDVIRGLDSGADDYVVKGACAIKVLMARLRAQLRMFNETDSAHIQVGPYTFKPAQKVMTIRDTGQSARLTAKEVSILKHLHRKRGETCSREELLRHVWGYASGVTTHTLETHIYRLRQKIDAAMRQGSIIATEHGGYSLTA
jgi:DNA-binding response OmpR family regulator